MTKVVEVQLWARHIAFREWYAFLRLLFHSFLVISNVIINGLQTTLVLVLWYRKVEAGGFASLFFIDIVGITSFFVSIESANINASATSDAFHPGILLIVCK